MTEPSDVLRVIHGDPSAEELTALVVALLGRGTSETAGGRRPRPYSGWTDHARNLPSLPQPGPGAWRASAWPH